MSDKPITNDGVEPTPSGMDDFVIHSSVDIRPNPNGFATAEDARAFNAWIREESARAWAAERGEDNGAGIPDVERTAVFRENLSAVSRQLPSGTS